MMGTAQAFVHADVVPPLLVRRISSFVNFYPRIDVWFHTKVVPGLLDNSRKLFMGPCGSFAIAKMDAHERKICTLWVEPEERRIGVATRLLDEAVEWLETEYPVITLPGEKELQFRRLFEKRGFHLVQRLDEYYRPQSCELVYNGWLSNSD